MQWRLPLGLHHTSALASGGDDGLSARCLTGDARGRLGGQVKIELLQQEGEVLVWSRVARQNQPPSIDRWDPDIDHVNGGKFLQDRRRRQPGCVTHQAILERDLETVRQERDQDVGVDPLLEVMVSRSNAEVTLQVRNTAWMWVSCT